ncbi:MAG: DUF2330 domain-containing protein [Deltaproteobacteria bacterium]|nr:DUF2330 domain-containing protein [Deltaproteobacteria bacterium]
MRFGHLFLASAALAAVVTLDARDAQACGGCFPPPGEAQSVVTDHRMVLTVSQQQTTLYDQIRYSGNPSSFAWVLPIAGTVTVGLSADTVFQGLENLTQTTVQAPPTGCPGPTNCDYEAATASDARGSAGSSSGGGVDVLKQETVGPYATVQLRSTDPQALDNWLTTNGFAIPDDVKPVIAAYVGEKFDFLALKLLPGKGVAAMRPVRVTTSGATAVLPLRMVAAGTGANVGVALWVVGEGRYEPQNFPFFSIRSEDLTWDWATNTSDYKELRAAKTVELAGKGWEIESSIDIDRTQFESIVQRVGSVNPQAGSDYAPIEENGQVVKSADQVRREDMQAFFSGLDGRVRVTRTRADLAKAALASDLVLIASGDQSPLSNIRQPKLQKGQPTCTVYSGCTAVGTAPRDEAVARSGGGTESFSCKTAPKQQTGMASLATVGGLAALVALVFVRNRRRDRR